MSSNSEETKKEGKTKKCIICDAPAEYSIKGIPQTCYCRECALKQFKQLNYLEKL